MARERARRQSCLGVSYPNLDDLRRASKTITGFAGVQEGSVSIAAPDMRRPTARGRGGSRRTSSTCSACVWSPAGRSDRRTTATPTATQVAIVSEALAQRGFGTAAGARRTSRSPERPADDDRRRRSPTLSPGPTPLSRVRRLVSRARRTGTSIISRADQPDARRTAFLHVRRAARPRRDVCRRRRPSSTCSCRRWRECTRTRTASSERSARGSYPGLGPSELQRERYAELVRSCSRLAARCCCSAAPTWPTCSSCAACATARDRAIRLALGASRARLVALQLTESGLLAAGGGRARPCCSPCG